MSEKVYIKKRHDQKSINQLLNPTTMDFLSKMHRKFEPGRQELLTSRINRQNEFEQNPAAIKNIEWELSDAKKLDWQIDSIPNDLLDRRVEITGPVNRKMVINALNSGASTYMADFEDSTSPTWENILDGHQNLVDAIDGSIDFTAPNGKSYALKQKVATLLVRPRGLHLNESGIVVDDEEMSGALFDFGLYFFHNAKKLLNKESGPYFYLPKLQDHTEAKWWNDVFVFAQNELGIGQGKIKVTVLIENILASLQMESILFQLKNHIVGFNAGRWDYIFSVIKHFNLDSQAVLPDRNLITMEVPFMRAYAKKLVNICHKRKAYAIGGMSAFIPDKNDPEFNKQAIQKVRMDKRREANDGFEGTWVAHPGLVNVAMEEFQKVLGNNLNQMEVVGEVIPNSQLLDFKIGESSRIQVTEQGIRTNISVALVYIREWLNGNGAVNIHGLMEDAATAEISRAQLWQWLKHKVPFHQKQIFTPDAYKKLKTEELGKLENTYGKDKFGHALEILDGLVLDSKFYDFLTIPAYKMLDRILIKKHGGMV